MADRSFEQTQRIRAQRGIPGINSRVAQREIWENWDWSSRNGDEWTLSDKWKQSVLNEIMLPRIEPAHDVLEIGPGAGRWSQMLIERARSYVGIDIAAACVEICEERFGHMRDVRFQLGSGHDLKPIETGSIDRVWSFDTFVHIDSSDARDYTLEFGRVLRKDGMGIIHHGDTGGYRGGWRSNLTTVELHGMLRMAGLEIIQVVREWQDRETGEWHRAGLYDDVITIFGRVPDARA
jgi:SAM-dependent methyltransferase